MKFVFATKKIAVSNAVNEYAEKKIGKLERYFKSESDASVTFSVEKDRNCVEATVRSAGLVLRASESTSDMYASIDACVASMERQIRKNKNRLEKRLRSEALEQVTATTELSDFAQASEELDYTPTRTKRFPMEMMSVEEAILQMNLVGHTFFAFKNGDAGGVFSVVYLRHDGKYGVIEDAG